MQSAVFLLPVWCCIALGQQPPAKPKFEVATVRPADPNPENRVLVGMSADPSLVRYRNMTLRDAIRGAYMVRDFQIAGPDWMATLRFEVDAKMPAGASTDQIPEMFQSLLEDRFGLTFRRDPKEMQIYALLAGQEGPKLKPADMKAPNNQAVAMGTDGKPRPLVYFGGSASAVTVTAPAASLLTLVGVTSRFTAKPLVDETGIEGLYDFKLTFAPEVTDSLSPAAGGNAAGPSEPAPTLSAAVKQYGLRIETRKEKIDMFVVTHLEKTPTDN